MGKGRSRWFKTLFGILASVSALFVSSVGGGREDEARTVTAPSSRCINKSYMLISTLDGRVSALDLNKQGSLLWSVQADIRPLLSSSLENLQVVQDGVASRLLPSLDGGLYQYDGKHITYMPYTAETLLSSSAKLSDDTMMIGAKDIKTYGIDVKTGKVRYVCTASGCQYCGTSDVSTEDIVVITRSTNTVRAVDARTGLEKWNFSVGQHEVRYVPSDPDASTSQDDDATIVICPSDDELDEESFSDTFGENYKNTLRFSVPEGNIVALNPDNPTRVKWQHKFSSAIANVWLLRGGHFEALDLFDQRYNPALFNLPTDENTPTQTFLYFGSFKQQPYVQISSHMQNLGTASQSSNSVAVGGPKVSWRPYLNRADSYTQALRGNFHSQANKEGSNSDDHSLIVWSDEYPFDNGYYLYPDFKHPLQIEMVPENKTKTETPAMTKKEWFMGFAATVFLAIMIHQGATRYNARKLQAENDEDKAVAKSNNSNSSGLPSSKSDFDLTEPVKPEADFKSRFSQEFDSIQCLGKGGFGVVFEAKNKMDDCSYAVKRIALPNREDAREKMMREVKALAKLDHAGIVRYFHAWLETPPMGWQQDWDQSFTDSELLTRTPCNSGTTTTESPIPVKKAMPKPLSPQETVPLALFLQEDMLSSGGGLSGGFSTHSAGSTDESGSFSLGIGEELGPHGDGLSPATQGRTRSSLSQSRSQELSSDSIVFQDEDDSDSGEEDDIAFVASMGLSKVSGAKRNSCDIPIPGGGGQKTLWTNPQFSFSMDSASQDNSGTPVDNTQSNSIVFRDDLVSSEGDTSSGGKPHGEGGLPFQLYQNSSSLSRSRQDSFSVVFEDSGCRDRSSNEGESRDGAKLDLSSTGERDVVEKSHVVQMESSARMAEKGRPDPVPKAYLYIQMQLCRRETLKDWLAANFVRDKSVLDIFDQIVSAVDYVHGQGMMHRDLKPSNIFFSMDGAVKIGDFGLVTAVREQQDEVVLGGQSDGQKHTAEVGTQLYMSPEQIAKKPYDFKVDIFSLGMILYELLVPFDTQMERIRCLQNAKRLNFPLTFQKEKPQEFEFVQQLLSHEPAQRPTTEQILNSPLLEAFAQHRVSHRFRNRTISSSSNASDKLVEL